MYTQKIMQMPKCDRQPGQSHLPTPLKFSLLSQSGNQLQEVQARDHDNFMQMRPFWGQARESFTIQIRADAVSLMENFTI
jgi:hypothetical protein